MRAAGLTVIVVALGLEVRNDPHPAGGAELVAVIALAAILIGGAGLVLDLGRRFGAAVGVLLLAGLIAGSVALAWVAPNGRGFLAGFLAASVLAARVPRRIGVAVGVLFLGAYAVASVLGTHQSISSILVGVLGTAACYRLGWFAHQLRERTIQAENLVIEVERNRAAQVRAVQIAERQRLAREMHDVLAHSLSGLVLHLEGARLLAERQGADPRLVDAVVRSRHLAESGLDEARQAIGVLRDADLPGPERLGSLAAAFARDSGVRCDFAVDGEPAELGAQTRLTLYRVAQEALTNVRKHANADRVDMRLTYGPAGTCLMVEDFATDVGPVALGDGYGVSGMRERAELLGGALHTAATSTGFRVALWIPS